MEKIQIRKSGMEDIPEIMDIIRQAVRSLKSRGVDQWQDGYPNEEILRGDIKKGISYVVCDVENGKERIIGTAAVSFEPEPVYADIYDGGWCREEPYAVIHRIATAEDKKGQGVAGILMDYACQCCREKKVRWLRIDTHKDNQVMHRFLTKQGFARRGSITLESGAHRFGYDKMID